MPRNPMPATESGSDWEARALCADPDNLAASALYSVWTDDTPYPSDKRAAQRMCIDDCPVRMQCIQAALQDHQTTGIRGGFTFTMGAVSRDDSRRIKELIGVPGATRQVRRQVPTAS